MQIGVFQLLCIQIDGILCVSFSIVLCTLTITIMPPRKHYAKSEEFVYKKTGTGPRARYKMMATDIPQAVGTSTGGADPEVMTRVPPIVLAPKETPTYDDLPYCAEGDGTRPTKTGKVWVSCQSCPFIPYRPFGNRGNLTT
jgi:hypothetical protein